MEVDPVQLAGETGYDLEGKSYMLPIRITGCDNPSVKIQAGAVTYVKVATKAKWTGTWTETILEGESGISTTAGSVLSVKLYTRHAVIANAVGDENCQNMMSGWILDDDGTVFIYYASSDTRMHVAVSTVDRLLDYCINTKSDGLRSMTSVQTLCALIDKNMTNKEEVLTEKL